MSISEGTIEFILDDLKFNVTNLNESTKITRSLIHTLKNKYLRKNDRGRAKKIRPDNDILIDPDEALFFSRGGIPVMFECPIDKCVIANGLSHASDGWHYFTAALREYEERKCDTYDGSLLEQYYRIWQPSNAREALLDTSVAPAKLEDFPPQTRYPWSVETYSQTKNVHDLRLQERDSPGSGQDIKYERLIKNIQQHGGGLSDYVKLRLGARLEGSQHHGPVPSLRGALEYAKLIHVYNSIKEKGYRTDMGGPATVRPVRWQNDTRYLIWEGNHRIAAMSVLGYETIPAIYGSAWIPEVDTAGSWPLVKHGPWCRRSALHYIEHLFNFDSRRWYQTKVLNNLKT